jgi:hypothetical protein
MTDPGSLVVRGGPAGTAARLDDLDRAGDRLRAAGRVMASVAVRAGQVAADPRWSLTAPLSPGTWWEAERQLARALGPPRGAVVVAARLTALGTAAHGASDLYRAADATADAGLHALDALVGRAVGALVALPVLAAVTSPVAVVTAAATVGAVTRDGPPVGPALLRLVGAHTGAVEHAVDALPGALGGLLCAEPLLALAAIPVTGMPVVPFDVPGGARWVHRAASAGPWLRETGRVTVVSRRAVPVRPPRSTAEIVRGVSSVSPDGGAAPGTVRVVGLTGAGGRRSWIVQIPGTQEWSPQAGRNPFDLTGDVAGMAGAPTAVGGLVTTAMRSAGARPGEPVLLAGHSQGGIVAAQLAADPHFRASYRVTHVLTAGSPVGAVPVPDAVTVLSLEHHEDVVPRLDGTVNPDRPGWLTVSRGATSGGGGPDPAAAHDLAAYAATADAVDAADDPGLSGWREGVRPFLGGPGVSATAVEVTAVRDVSAGPIGRP